MYRIRENFFCDWVGSGWGFATESQKLKASGKPSPWQKKKEKSATLAGICSHVPSQMTFLPREETLFYTFLAIHFEGYKLTAHWWPTASSSDVIPPNSSLVVIVYGSLHYWQWNQPTESPLGDGPLMDTRFVPMEVMNPCEAPCPTSAKVITPPPPPTHPLGHWSKRG